VQAGDNGNVLPDCDNRDGNRTQNFLYDSLNRIQQAYSNGIAPLSTVGERHSAYSRRIRYTALYGQDRCMANLTKPLGGKWEDI